MAGSIQLDFLDLQMYGHGSWKQKFDLKNMSPLQKGRFQSKSTYNEDFGRKGFFGADSNMQCQMKTCNNLN
ncbi:MAG: hypothetical protein JJU02_01420 [Cryomorphaceae bacterium]|nr:hypothetical protein [Cryomorphaceae bacterium]